MAAVSLLLLLRSDGKVNTKLDKIGTWPRKTFKERFSTFFSLIPKLRWSSKMITEINEPVNLALSVNIDLKVSPISSAALATANSLRSRSKTLLAAYRKSNAESLEEFLMAEALLAFADQSRMQAGYWDEISKSLALCIASENEMRNLRRSG